jgi:AraC-like DNA-binding protein
VHLWRISYDPKTQGHRHFTAEGVGHALLASLAPSIFELLRVSATVWEHGNEWMAIHSEPTVIAFELEYAKDSTRYAYNEASFERVIRQRKIIQGQHGGYSDFFVPIVIRKTVIAILCAGPFSSAPPTRADILERWRGITGRQGHLSDPEFAAFLSMCLSVLVLDAAKVRAFEQLLGCLARLMAGEGRADELMNRIETLRAALAPARQAETSWTLVREVLDDLSRRSPYSTPRRNDLRDAGLAELADHALVGLAATRQPDLDPVEEAIRRDAFQRSAVALARSVGDAAAGQVGDHGVVFLSGLDASAQKKKQKVLLLANRVSALGRKFGFSVHFGACPAYATAPLATSYHAALGAAETALVQRKELLFAAPSEAVSRPSLRRLRQELEGTAEERPSAFQAKFAHYLESVAAECGHRIDLARAHLEIGFERITDPLVRSGVLDEKSRRVMVDELDRAATSSRTTQELLEDYRRVAHELLAAVRRPAPARQDRNLRGAIEYIHKNYGKRLRREQVARVAGFAPGYFSDLFKRREQMTFESYLQDLRIARAKQLLETTHLEAARVAELTGFRSPQYFSNAFRQATGMSPIAYRRRHQVYPLPPQSD